MWAPFREQVHEKERLHSQRASLAAGSVASLSDYRSERLSCTPSLRGPLEVLGQDSSQLFTGQWFVGTYLRWNSAQQRH